MYQFDMFDSAANQVKQERDLYKRHKCFAWLKLCCLTLGQYSEYWQNSCRKEKSDMLEVLEDNRRHLVQARRLIDLGLYEKANNKMKETIW